MTITVWNIKSETCGVAGGRGHRRHTTSKKKLLVIAITLITMMTTTTKSHNLHLFGENDVPPKLDLCH